MSDIVERLRRGVDTNEPPDKTDDVMSEAADEIEQLQGGKDALQAEIERLREELEKERGRSRRLA